MRIVKDELKDCQTIKNWAYSVQIMQKLMKEDNMYLNELFLLSLIYTLTVKYGRPVNQVEVTSEFNILSYSFRKMLKRLLDWGFIKNDRIGAKVAFNPLQLSVTPLGEQLLIKYEKVMQKLCNGP
jgi:predicted transcriptional regulator